ncbi:phosphatidylinositol 4,5-biphosphate-dependent ARF1 GTPase-activating protein [Trichinella spiralis]|uniref:phosphatidylinositol 4,5-biphosphate-dependent ARF1 GTPase-activating protein n=1 Tax=Trichinella spiralis TaxID=6334 RepID=UPI0001EFCFF8|nr:phosphatidylinositol 4,5-biphosphate-dependent ARF1 GTPase-activating protein [Trichinella spiralis]
MDGWMDGWMDRLTNGRRRRLPQVDNGRWKLEAHRIPFDTSQLSAALYLSIYCRHRNWTEFPIFARIYRCQHLTHLACFQYSNRLSALVRVYSTLHHHHQQQQQQHQQHFPLHNKVQLKDKGKKSSKWQKAKIALDQRCEEMGGGGKDGNEISESGKGKKAATCFRTPPYGFFMWAELTSVLYSIIGLGGTFDPSLNTNTKALTNHPVRSMIFGKSNSIYFYIGTR